MNNILLISFLGLPASGKGTQAEILASKIGAKVLGIGDLIREEIEHSDLSDPFYKDIKNKYDKGIPQEDEVVLDIIRKNIEKYQNKIIFDNFPFSKNQASLFFDLCQKNDAGKPILIIVKIKEETALKRVLDRKVCSKCESVFIDDGNQICDKCGGALISRSDDNEEVLKKRIEEYLPRMLEVENEFKNNGIILEVDGENSIKEVAEQILKKLKDGNFI